MNVKSDTFASIIFHHFFSEGIKFEAVVFN